MAWELPPRIVQWDITNQCNLACGHCRAKNLNLKKEAKEFLGLDDVIAILDNIFSFVPDASIAFAGGEPLIRKDLKEILWYTKANLWDGSVEVLSNGTLINSENVKWLAEYVDGFNISLDGASEDVHDAIRGRGSFGKSLNGIEKLVSKKARVAVRMTFLNQKEDEPEKLAGLLKEIGVDFLNFRYFVPVGWAYARKIDARQYERISRNLLSAGERLGVKIGFSDPFPEILVSKKKREEISLDIDLLSGKAMSGCSVAFDLLYLDPQGIVSLCPYFPIMFADAKKEDLERVWFENKFLKTFRHYRASLRGECGRCKYKFACGGCRGSAWAISGDSLGSDPRCWHRADN